MAASTGLHTLAVASAVRPLTLEKAKRLAFKLEVPLPVLDNIEARYKGEDRKFHFIQEWLDRDVSASWEKLVSGLEKIDMTVLAAEIKANFVEEPQITGSSASGGQLQPTASPFSTLSSLETVDMPIELTPKCLSPAVFSTANSFTASAPSSSTTSTRAPTTTVLLPHPSADVTDSVSLSTAHSSLTTPSSSTVSTSTILPHTPITTPISSTDTRTRDPANYSQTSSNAQQPPSFTATPEPAIVAVAPTPAPTTTSATPTQSEPVDDERVAQVRASIERFEDEFSDLFVDAQLSWSEREARERLFTKRFRAHLLALPVSKKASHIKFFQQHRKEIRQAKDIDVLCDILTQYSNYTNYEIIFHLVKKFCREELKTRMISYRDSFTAFEMATTTDVYLCAISARPESEIRAGFVKMAMKINKPTSACTLHEIRQLRESIAENASLHSYSMYIENPTGGSVVAAFRVPSHCIWFIARAVTPELTLEQRLSDVTIAGRDLTHWDSNFSRSTWTARAALMKEYVTDGADGQYLQGRDYHTSSFLSGSGRAEYTSARDLSTGKMFVIKSTTYDDEEMLEGLTKESDMLSRIPLHKNIVTFIGSMLEETLLENDTVSQRCNLFAELAEHGSLANMIEDAQGGEMGSSVGVDQSLFYLRQILLGVAHLRSLHVLHLNINSENILILEGGRRLKLTNFEKALYFEDVSRPGMLPLTGVAPHFAAPEVIRREELSFYSDVWSSVCVFIHLVTGSLPGHRAGLTSRDSMRDMLMKYRDEDMEKLVPLSEMVLDRELVSIFRDTLRDGSRPSALTLLKYPALKNADMYEHNFPALRQREGSEAPLPLGSELHIAGPSATPVSKPPTTDEEEKVVHKGGQKRPSKFDPVRRRRTQSSRYILQSSEGVEPLKPKMEGPTREPTTIHHMPREMIVARESASRSDTSQQAASMASGRLARHMARHWYRSHSAVQKSIQPEMRAISPPQLSSYYLSLIGTQSRKRSSIGEEVITDLEGEMFSDSEEGVITDFAHGHFHLQPYHVRGLSFRKALVKERQRLIDLPFQREVRPIASPYRHPSQHDIESSLGLVLDVAHGPWRRPRHRSVPLPRSQASSPGESSMTGSISKGLQRAISFADLESSETATWSPKMGRSAAAFDTVESPPTKDRRNSV